MKITVFSIVPLFPAHDMGGAQKHLRYVALQLGELGHQVDVLCTRRYDTTERFQWHPNVTVHPILRFKQPFPNPYDTGAANLAHIVQAIGAFLETSDRFYIHDGEWLFPFVHEHMPTVVSLRDNVYPETIKGAFLFRSHKLIVISDYSRKFYQATVGRFFPELSERMVTIGNGLDWAHFKPTDPAPMLARLPVDVRGRPVVLHPHRPEDSKGIWQTLDVARRLVQDYGLRDLAVLVPRWIGTEGDAGVRDFYARVEAQIERDGLRANIVFHDWVPYDLLPAYYSLGTVTFSLGSFVESFGNAVYESLGCGTPSLTSRVATHRELLPEGMLDRVDYDDNRAAAEIAYDIIREGRRTAPEVLAYLREHYDFKRQLERYADVIENAAVSQSMRYVYRPLDATTRYKLAPWCYLAGQGIYHDFEANYKDDALLRRLVTRYPEGFSLDRLGGELSAVQLDDWYQRGYVVPE